MTKYLGKIQELVDFLTLSVVRPNELGRHLTLRTFDFLKPKSVYFVKINDDGTLSAVDCFGYSDEQISPFTSIDLNKHFPICESVRNNEIQIIANPEDWIKNYPDYAFVPTRLGWKSILTIPIKINNSPVGAMSITFNESINVTEELVQFINAISSIVALQLTRVPHGRMGSIELNGNEVTPAEFLSKRQVEILRYMADGLTNSQIARQLGYSESTIRHETMKIYETLKVRGRKEAVHFALVRKIIERVSVLLPLLIFDFGNQLELAIAELPLIGV